MIVLEDTTRVIQYVSIPQRVRLRPRFWAWWGRIFGSIRFPSLKGFDFGLDRYKDNKAKMNEYKFPSLKGFDFGLDMRFDGTCHPRPEKFPSLKGFDFGLDLNMLEHRRRRD